MRAEGSSGPAGLWGSVCLLSEWLVLEALLDRGVFREKMGVLWASIRLIVMRKMQGLLFPI